MLHNLKPTTSTRSEPSATRSLSPPMAVNIPVNGSSFLKLCITCHKSSRVNASNAPKGSSKIRTSGLCTNALHNDALCRIPPDSSEGFFCSNPSNPTKDKSCFALCSRKPSELLHQPLVTSYRYLHRPDGACEAWLEWWAHQDLNLGPIDYESTALTN